MVAQCLVISLILLGISVCFFRTRRKKWALSVLPLITLPLTNAIVFLFCDLLEIKYIFIFPLTILVTAAVISVLFVGICAVLIFKSKRMRIPYILIGTVFNLALSLILLMHYYNLLV